MSVTASSSITPESGKARRHGTRLLACATAGTQSSAHYVGMPRGVCGVPSDSYNKLADTPPPPQGSTLVLPRALSRKGTPIISPLYAMSATRHRRSCLSIMLFYLEAQLSAPMLSSTSGGMFAREQPCTLPRLRDATSVSQRSCGYLTCPQTRVCWTHAMS